MKSQEIILWVLCSLLVAACAGPNVSRAPVEERSAPGATTGKSTPAPADNGVEIYSAPQTAPAFETRPFHAEPLPTDPQSPGEEPYSSTPVPAAAQSPAVLALLDSANRQASAGKWDSAGAALERALRIEPRDARLWQRLAEVRIKQNQPQQAETLATRSNTLAGGDRVLQGKNWRLIAQARKQRGDHAGAQAAEAKAQALAPQR